MRAKKMQRVTEKELDGIVARINRITGNPETSYTKNQDGKYVQNAGNYYLSWAYGGVTLHQMMESGSMDVLRCGYVSKRELQGLLFAFIDGIATEPKKN
jgi:hypothetical protein